MAVVIPFIGTIFAPTFALALFIFGLAYYRYKIEKYEETPEPAPLLSKSEEAASCGNCACGKKNGDCSTKIKRLSILYGTTTGTVMFTIFSILFI